MIPFFEYNGNYNDDKEDEKLWLLNWLIEE